MAETSRHERRRHFRGKPRPGRRLPVRWAAAGVWEAAETRNIGVGGAFIATAAPPLIGTEIAVELHIPTREPPVFEGRSAPGQAGPMSAPAPPLERSFAVKAVVRWRQTAASDAVDAAGMGVEFVEVDIDVLLELNDYFASLTGLDGPATTRDEP
jgi:hypothetical protein